MAGTGAGSEDNMDHRSLITSFARDNPTVPALQFIRDDPEGVLIKLIPDGIVNHVFRVKSRAGKESIIIKHSESHFKDEPETEVPLKRQQLEYDSMVLMDSIQPGSVPTPFCLDTTHNIIAMRDLGDWELLFDRVYMEKDINLEAAAHLGKVLGTVHTQTSRNNVTPQQWEELKAKFKHDDLKDFISVMHHLNQYIEHKEGNNIPEEFSASYHKLVNDIKQQGLDMKVIKTVKEEVCLIHSDCHQGNIFVKDGKTACIDFEFGFLGHPAEHVALPIQGYVFTYILDEAHQASNQTQDDSTSNTLKAKCKKAIRTMLEAYLEHRTDLGNNESELREFFSALTLLAGSFIFFIGGRAFGTMSGCAGMHRSDRGHLMTHAHKLMTHHLKVTTLDEFMDLV